MPESRGRRPKPKPRQIVPLRLRHQKPEEHRKTLWERIRDHPIIWGLGVVAALIAVGTPMYQAFLDPEIDVSELGATLPFAAPIKVTNQGFICNA